ncbi:MAG: hypothetical protein KDC69_00010 [Flavobacteriaceae bacterium]|nr:hypothetical protein [Flavobacteriaceae bacterium]MCB0474018.1 hypothetical protein [Flavobacteriaceae bacterium]
MEKHKLPYALTSLVFGVLSILLLVAGLFSIIFGFLGLVHAKKALKIYKEKPDMYIGYKRASIGKITSLTGIFLGIFSTIVTIYFLTLGSNPFS